MGGGGETGGGGVTAIYMYFPYHVLLPQILPALQRITPVFRLIKRTRNLGFWQAVPDRLPTGYQLAKF